ncbi:hypothetical protein FJV76_18470 [Mesorhizobium sp. WSM4303]|nr:hypothetical protein FJV77_03380 [Mesorhizobium sp. WSM4306]TRD02638.1 hypothetical protein FJV76_18470 [Mesorhizobium sp. WSM4303]
MRLDLCHRFAAIASAKSVFLSSAVNLFSTMIGDHWCMSPKSAERFWDNDMHENNESGDAVGRSSGLVGLPAATKPNSDRLIPAREMRCAVSRSSSR